MTDAVPEPGSDALAPTRQSLLARLRDCEDQEGWREFFDTYWRLIYHVARRAGLADAEAQDVVQTTFIYLARRMPRFRYDPARGSFKSWLRVVTRSRLSEFVRREKIGDGDPAKERLPDDGDEALAAGEDALDDVWQREWEQNLLDTALRRLRTKISSQQLLIFRTAVLNGVPLGQVAKTLNISLARVYLARHRVGRMFKEEVRRIRKETE